MEITTRATAGRSNQQNNATSIGNTGGEHFSYFSTIETNSFGGFKTFWGNNNNNPPLGNNNNNNLLSSLPPSKFEGGFNSLSRENTEGLDLNVAALVNALTRANLRINHVEKELNHIKSIEFKRIEAEDPNKWLKQYNRIAEVNKWSEHRRF